MPESFGARMREQRERQQIALSTIVEQTKIKVSLLEALERDDVSHWPTGIFRRAFVRAYALAIGLEPDAVLRDFLELYPDPPEVFADALASSADDGRATEGAPRRFKYLVASALGSVSRLRARANPKPEPGLQAVAVLPPMTAPVEPLSVEARAMVEEEPAVKAMLPVREVETPGGPDVPVPTDLEIPMTAVPVAAPSDPERAVSAAPVAEAPASVQPADSYDPDLMSVAHLCTELCRVQTTADIPPLLHEMTRILDGIGIIIWLWDPIANELLPALTHGYAERVVTQLPRVERDTNNATAAAFRAERTCIVKGDDVENGALAVPLLGPGGCFGVLAIELPERREEKECVRAHAMIFAAQLATLIGSAQPLEASDRRLA